MPPSMKKKNSFVISIQLLVFEAKTFEDLILYKIPKENSKSVGGSLFDTLYNVAKSSTSNNAPTNTKDQPELIRRSSAENSHGFVVENPTKFCSLVLREVDVFFKLSITIKQFNRES